MRTLFAILLTLAFTGRALAQVVLTGMTAYLADNLGRPSLTTYWNTLGGDGAYNVYLFTNTPTGPVFLNSGDTTATLSPNLTLLPGDHHFEYAGEGYDAFAAVLGLNLYFNNQPDQRISVLRGQDGTDLFQIVATNRITYGLSGNEYGTGKKSVVIGDQQVTLIAWTRTLPRPDMVSGFSTVPSGEYETAARFTLRVDTRPTIRASLTGTNLQICWPSQSNSVYKLEFRSFTNTVWGDTFTKYLGTGGELCVTQSLVLTNAGRIYRATIVP